MDAAEHAAGVLQKHGVRMENALMYACRTAWARNAALTVAAACVVNALHGQSAIPSSNAKIRARKTVLARNAVLTDAVDSAEHVLQDTNAMIPANA
jgi:hypothetical protein